jgi:hypothetical protein
MKKLIIFVFFAVVFVGFSDSVFCEQVKKLDKDVIDQELSKPYKPTTKEWIEMQFKQNSYSKAGYSYDYFISDNNVIGIYFFVSKDIQIDKTYTNALRRHALTVLRGIMAPYDWAKKMPVQLKIVSMAGGKANVLEEETLKYIQAMQKYAW